MHQYLPELLQHVEEEWRNHIADDFRWLSRIPSGTVSANCEAFRKNPARRDVAFLIRYAKGEISAEERSAIWNEYLAVSESTFLYKPISEWKLALKYQIENEERPSEEKQMLEEFWRQIAEVETPRAAEIRSALRPILIREFGVKLVSDGGGLWSAGISLNGLPLSLVFDFGGFARGFRHELWLPLKLEGSLRARLSYESALGFNVPPWDLLRTDVLSEQLELTAELIKRVLGWLAAIDWSSKELDTHVAAIPG